MKTPTATDNSGHNSHDYSTDFVGVMTTAVTMVKTQSSYIVGVVLDRYSEVRSRVEQTFEPAGYSCRMDQVSPQQQKTLLPKMLS